MKYLLVVLGALVVGGCSGSGNLQAEKDAFYDELAKQLVLMNGALNAVDSSQEKSRELTLARLTTPRYEWLAADALNAERDDRRDLAVFGLGFCRQSQAGEVLVKALDDRVPLIRSLAVVSLARQDPLDPPFDKIFLMLDENRPAVRLAVLFALKSLMKRGEDRGKLATLTALVDDSEPDVRNEAVLVLRRLRIKSTLPVLIKTLSDPSFLVRMNGALAIAEFGAEAGEDVTPHLVELLKDTENVVVESAWLALRRVTGKDFDRMYGAWRDWYDDEQKRWEYVCTDHAEVIKQVAGSCPTCGKRLLKQARPTKPRADVVYTCPTHPEVSAPSPGKCAKCKADLIPKK
jgi:hypothetical protein